MTLEFHHRFKTRTVLLFHFLYLKLQLSDCIGHKHDCCCDVLLTMTDTKLARGPVCTSQPFLFLLQEASMINQSYVQFLTANPFTFGKITYNSYNFFILRTI